MRRIVFRLGMFQRDDDAYSRRALAIVAYALAEANVAYLRSHPETPSLSRTRLRAVAPAIGDEGAEEWKGIASILDEREADPVSLASWRCAERIMSGERARVLIRWTCSREDGAPGYRVVVTSPKGALEEPAALVQSANRCRCFDPIREADPREPASDIALRLSLFRGERERAYSERVLKGLLRALTRANLAYLQTHSLAPLLYRAGVRYRAETFPSEQWKGIAEVIRDRHGDCEDLACYRSAELIARGLSAQPVFRWRALGRLSIYHILVRYPDGSIEDPSLLLGMGKRGASAAELGVEEGIAAS